MKQNEAKQDVTSAMTLVSIICIVFIGMVMLTN